MGSKPIRISASRGAAILGLSDWSTPVDAWLKIMDDLDPEFCSRNKYQKPERIESASMRWGTAFEKAIIEEAQERIIIENIDSKTGVVSDYEIKDFEKYFSHAEYDFITCHIDGAYYLDGKPAGIIHEGKTTNLFSFNDKWGEPGSDRVPREYQIQVQHQMICTGHKEVIISVLVFPKRPDEFETQGLQVPGYKKPEINGIINLEEGKSLEVLKDPHIINPSEWTSFLSEMGFFHGYRINADPELQKLMIDAYNEFWINHVIGQKPPEPQSYEDIRKLVIEPKGTIVADEKIERLSQEYKDINTEIRSVYARKDEIKTKILEEMRNRSEVPIDDESQEKWILRNRQGKKMHSYNGKMFK